MAATGVNRSNYQGDPVTHASPSADIPPWGNQQAQMNTLVPILNANRQNTMNSHINSTSSQSTPMFSMVDTSVTPVATSEGVPTMGFGGPTNAPVPTQFENSILTSNGNNTNEETRTNERNQNKFGGTSSSNGKRGVGEIGAASGLYMLSKAHTDPAEEELSLIHI